jgi:hypothetical protein
MKKTLISTGFLIICNLFVFAVPSPVSAQGLDLVGILVKSLGVTTPQAEGGAGAIFNTAEQNLTEDEFTQVKTALPEVEPLMAAAPKAAVSSGSLGGVSSMLGQSAGGLGKLAGLSGIFPTLGMDSGMVAKFIPIILDYAQTKGGDTVASLLKMALQ